MKIHSKHIIRTLDIFYAIFLPLGSILLAGVIFFIIGGVYTILIQHFPIIDSVPFWIVGRIYICLCAIAILCGTIHHFRWFILRKKFNIPCHHCGKMVEATRKEELEITLSVTPWAYIYVCKCIPLSDLSPASVLSMRVMLARRIYLPLLP